MIALRKRSKILTSLAIATIMMVWLFLPISEPTYPFSTVLNDRNGELLGASIAADGQWRFPESDSLASKLRICIQYFEDKHFYLHPGVNPLAVGRAILQNIKAGSVVSGASTLTMQIARMMRQRERTIWQKLIEMGLALKLELRYSKSELMIKYASMAPFGGNVVGVEAASWRYYHRPSHLLSWGEAASLAVLPNNPGAIFPGRAKEAYLLKRNRLLRTLLDYQIIDSTTYTLSILEELPGAPFPIPQKAPHLLTTLQQAMPGTIIPSSLDVNWQTQTTKILQRHHEQHVANGVDNAALIAIDLKSSEVLAYVGNTLDQNAEGHDIDLVHRPRSPGSSLKPILYAKALSTGQILPKTLLPDIPTFFGGFSPKNFSRGYEGAVPADQALIKSLNIPFAYLLRDYSYQQFNLDLKNLDFTSIDQPPGHYGLSLILGGGEISLWELSNGYLKMYQELSQETISGASVVSSSQKPTKKAASFDPAAIWHTFNTMKELKRPYGEESWQSYSSSQVISWKTGTSFGFRDAWAIGLNGTVLIGVWVGNADGEGRSGLTGIGYAAPILLEAMRISRSDQNWLEQLKPEMDLKRVCSISGYLAKEFCPSLPMEVPAEADRSGLCPFHQQILVDQSETFQVNSSCYSLGLAKQQTSFILPPTTGYYYQQNHPEYIGMVPFHPDCNTGLNNPIEIVYPNNGSKVFIPLELDGEKGRVVFNATHQNAGALLYWSINDSYFGSTSEHHKIEVHLKKGMYQLKVVDNFGNEGIRSFEVLGHSN